MNVNALSEQMVLLFVLIFVAYIASKVGLLPKNSNKVIADLVVNITNPATILYAVGTSSHALSNTAVLGILGLTIVVLGGQMLLGSGYTKALRLKADTAGVYGTDNNDYRKRAYHNDCLHKVRNAFGKEAAENRVKQYEYRAQNHH